MRLLHLGHVYFCFYFCFDHVYLLVALLVRFVRVARIRDYLKIFGYIEDDPEGLELTPQLTKELLRMRCFEKLKS